MTRRDEGRRTSTLRVVLVCLFVCFIEVNVASAHPPAKSGSQRSITDRSIEWPSWEQWRRVFLLQDYNTRIVVLGTTLLGCAAGMVGSFTLLRKRALMGDALSHATLPGIGMAFIIATYLGADAKSLPILLLGATVTGLIGVGTILAIRNWTRLKEDAALGIVLSVFFGAGISLLGVIQRMKEGNAAGLEAFIFGKTASMVIRDTMLIGGAALACIAACLMLFKEFKLLCFDEDFACSRGVPVIRLDIALMALVVIVCMVGLQAVGLILMIALLVIPAAAARFWTEKMRNTVIIASVLGAVGGMVGAAMSALFSKLPSGAMIVLVCATFFMFSMVFGPARGILVRLLRRLRLNRTVDHQHLLRAIYEILEESGDCGTIRGCTRQSAEEPRSGERSYSYGTAAKMDVAIRDLLLERSWSLRRLQRAIKRAERAGFVAQLGDRVRLTERGLKEAVRLTRQHRLWELYLITYADIAPSRVDRDADAIEHVLEPEIVAELETLLQESESDIPKSPHELASLEGR